MIKNISNLGDAAVYCDFGDEVNKEINSNVINYFQNLKDCNFEGITNLTPSYNKLIVSFDLSITNFENTKKIIENLEINKSYSISKKKIQIPVCCEDEYALDLKKLERKLNKSTDEILETFFSKEYFCYMTGFIAGMPFLGDIDKNLHAKRLETPRVKVPKGSIGLTEQFCNIYTFESPGGWNIIGNTPLNVFDSLNEDNPNLINPGDTVSFIKINKEKYQKYYE
ncbi:MAG: allophanate hydrolase subunit 1 [Candidatus Pelagibacter sp.]